jgi:hypothetical protein
MGVAWLTATIAAPHSPRSDSVEDSVQLDPAVDHKAAVGSAGELNGTPAGCGVEREHQDPLFQRLYLDAVGAFREELGGELDRRRKNFIALNPPLFS